MNAKIFLSQELAEPILRVSLNAMVIDALVPGMLSGEVRGNGFMTDANVIVYISYSC
jgi:hypothetical protein